MKPAWLTLWLCVGIVFWALVLRGAVAVVQSFDPPTWTTPSSAVHAITIPPESVQASEATGQPPVPRHNPTPTRALPRNAVRYSGPGVIGTPEPVDPAPTLVGTASNYGPLFSEAWVAIPRGPGWRIRVTGPGGSRTLVTTDKGPTVPGRIVDLPVRAFRAICGVPWTVGLCSVSVAILGRAP